MGSIPICETLVRRGAAIDGSEKYASNPLVEAVLGKHADVVAWLFAHGAHGDTTLYCPYSALDSAAESGQLGLMTILIEKGAHIRPASDRKSFPLGTAANAGQIAAMELLLTRGAAVDDTYNDGWTTLMVAAAASQLQAVELLVTKGARVDVINDKGDSAMDVAKGPQRDKIIALLKRVGS